jgi:hypothetical protein
MDEAVNTHSNARFAREVEWNVSDTATFQGARPNEKDATATPIKTEQPTL